MAGKYEVGYRKPPKTSQFRKGRSGNPKGRPKGTRNLKSDLSEELGERVTVRERSRETRISKQRAMLKSLLAGAIKGDTRAANTVLSLMARLIDPEDGGSTPELTAEEKGVFEAFKSQILEAARTPSEGGNPSAATPDNEGV